MTGILAGLTTAHVAHADQVTVFGMDRFGNSFALPSNLCVYAGQELRLVADAINAYGTRDGLISTAFGWRFTRASGVYTDWNAGISYGFDVFRHGYEPNSVYFFVPYDFGGQATLAVAAPGSVPVTFVLADPRTGVPCSFPPAAIYTNE